MTSTSVEDLKMETLVDAVFSGQRTWFWNPSTREVYSGNQTWYCGTGMDGFGARCRIHNHDEFVVGTLSVKDSDILRAMLAVNKAHAPDGERMPIFDSCSIGRFLRLALWDCDVSVDTVSVESIAEKNRNHRESRR